MGYSVETMESLIRAALNEPSQARITSSDILRTLNDGYKDVALKAFCIEHEDGVLTTIGSRLVPFSGHRVNFIELVSNLANLVFRDYLWVSCEASIESGVYWVSAPTFGMTSGYYIDILFPMSTTISHELAAAKRSIYYTTDGTTPTIASSLYDESHIHIPAFGVGETTKVIKAVAYADGDYSAVATLTLQPMINFKYGDQEVWLYDVPAISAGEIESGAYTVVINVWPEVFEEGTAAAPTLAISGGTIESGRYWDPVVEI